MVKHDPLSVIKVLAPRLRALCAAEGKAAVVSLVATAPDSCCCNTEKKLDHKKAETLPDSDLLSLANTNPQVLTLQSDNLSAALESHEPTVPTSKIGLDPITESLRELLENYQKQAGQNPQFVLVPEVGILAVGVCLAHTKHLQQNAREILAKGSGTTSTAVRTECPVTGNSTFPLPQGRMSGKVALVTGAAQGFGLGIAQVILAHGASVILADINITQAQIEANRITEQYGVGRAEALTINVGDEASCITAATEAVKLYGGVDIVVSNAGVLRAEGVMTQPVADFDLVTNVNYRGFFLVVKAFAPVLAAQTSADPNQWLDIVEVNSKSGLEGSKRNFAYAGSKFGGVGLTQSFALELVDYAIKVNAVCPGNYLDGPLWMHPEKGLFVQYLRANKVPGAKTVEDVRKFYEAKVPMGRGCTPEDVALAIIYTVEQAYETGQALPVTGGQTMLN